MCARLPTEVVCIVLECVSARGPHAFWIAAFYGQTSTMKLLASTKIDIYAKNHNGSNALHMAIKRGNVLVLQTLIEMQYDLDRPKNNGVTALGIAALGN